MKKIITLFCLAAFAVAGNAATITISDVADQNALYYPNGTLAEDYSLQMLTLWTQFIIDYEPGHFPRGTDYTLDHLIGDCTDRSAAARTGAGELGSEVYGYRLHHRPD